MTYRRLGSVLLVGIVAVFGIALLGQTPNRLGSIDFPTSGAAAAQPAFLRGVLLLHSFEYDDAKEAFVEAQRLDPAFAMAFWGEAMTYNHPLWAQTAPDAAREALSRLGPTPAARAAKAPTPKEKDWVASLDALYGAGDKLARDVAYANALKAMHVKYPNDLEVTAFYALALLGTSHNGRDFDVYGQAAKLAESVYAKNPTHPGAIHYLIHAYDDPAHASMGLPYAAAYGAVAPAASHALHMPTHIYFALGLWDDAAAMNERSIQAADDRIARKNLTVEDRGYHALLWLVYGYLQQGRYQDARAVVNQIEQNAAASGSARTRGTLMLARAAWIVETRRWADAKTRVPTSAGSDGAAADLFAMGMAAVRSGNLNAARDARQQMRLLGGPSPAASAMPAAPAPADPHAAHGAASPLPVPGGGSGSAAQTVMAAELDAALLVAAGQVEQALELAERAALTERTMSYEFGPPMPVKPAREFYGELLFDAGRARDAQLAFEEQLTRTPGRALSLLGLKRAAAASGDAAALARATDELRKVWHRADASLPELREVRGPGR